MALRKRILEQDSALSLVAALALLSPFPFAGAWGEPDGKDKAALEAVMAEARKAADEKFAKDPALKALAAKFPPVFLCSRRYEVEGNSHYVYSFSDEPADQSKLVPDGQLRFEAYDRAAVFYVNTNFLAQSNLVADLGAVDFAKDPNPKAVDVTGDGQYTWLPGPVRAVEGDVYLERVRDLDGNHFYVLFRVVAVDKSARYVAFLWRKLPGRPAPAHKAEPEVVMALAKRDVDGKVGKDPLLKDLAAKYPPVLLLSRRYALGRYFQSAYSFNNETADESKHGNEVQLLFDNGRREPFFEINNSVGQSNLVADLGKADFTVNPDPEDVNINGDWQRTWLPERCEAIEGHVYLERIWDDDGNRFFVLFKVVAVDDDARYMAFLWRRLPGGKVVKWPHTNK